MAQVVEQLLLSPAVSSGLREFLYTFESKPKIGISSDFFSPCFFLWFWVLLTSPDVGIEEDFKNVDCIVESSPSE